MKLVRFNNILLNLENFAGFEFEDATQCIWAYLPSQTNHKLDYIPLIWGDWDEYITLKDLIESSVNDGRIINNETPEKKTGKKQPPPLPPVLRKKKLEEAPAMKPTLPPKLTKPRPQGITRPPKLRSPFKNTSKLKK